MYNTIQKLFVYQLFCYLPPATTGGSFGGTSVWNRFWYSESIQSMFQFIILLMSLPERFQPKKIPTFLKSSSDSYSQTRHEVEYF